MNKQNERLLKKLMADKKKLEKIKKKYGKEYDAIKDNSPKRQK